eukprot:CAMPEP_0117758030 /NCGR_PEP_ID=MMETSP0947-20121206/15123_1 /TAXON_ID=44440 /ORGANISM="Chattonella subsalsa, Strain CCMP2191" /LENGTH=124 /DNA_ID=CAMNT_0005578115 /DNA_START=14 /DNA_END=389 /DNA_ORIENTATION=-
MANYEEKYFNTSDEDTYMDFSALCLGESEVDEVYDPNSETKYRSLDVDCIPTLTRSSALLSKFEEKVDSNTILSLDNELEPIMSIGAPSNQNLPQNIPPLYNLEPTHFSSDKDINDLVEEIKKH